MITAIIILSSLVLAAVFSIVWASRPNVRRQIESPKHWFQDQVRQYDLQYRDARTESEASTDESQ